MYTSTHLYADTHYIHVSAAGARLRHRWRRAASAPELQVARWGAGRFIHVSICRCIRIQYDIL